MFTVIEVALSAHRPTHIFGGFNPLLYVKNWTVGSDPFAPLSNPVQGQGNVTSQAHFENHILVTYGEKLYDPSYGLRTYENQLDWEDSALDFFGAEVITMAPGSPNQNKLLWIWKANPEGTTETTLEPNPY